VTVLGLIATFLMPWPGAESPTQAGHAVHTEVRPAHCVPAMSPSEPTDSLAIRVRAAPERLSGRG